MKIDVACANEPGASFLGVTMKDLWGKGERGIGIGGSEYALLTMCEAWHNAGHEVVLYNSPRGDGSPFEQRPTTAFDPNEDRDVVIIFRSPNPNGIIAKGLRVWWSCDQYTQGSFRDFAPTMDKIVTISPFHSEYFEKTYGITNSIPIDLPVRVQDFEGIEQEKIPYRLIFTSVPDRGLHLLYPMWEEIKLNFPEASLSVTSDYRLWGAPSPLNERHRMMWLGKKDVHFHGAIIREELIIEELKSQLLVFPNIYDELFCVSVAEAQFAGAYPITSTIGALQTTNMGTVIPGDPNAPDFRRAFIGAIIDLLGDQKKLERRQKEIWKRALLRFHPDRIIEEWNRKVFENE